MAIVVCLNMYGLHGKSLDTYYVTPSKGGSPYIDANRNLFGSIEGVLTFLCSLAFTFECPIAKKQSLKQTALDECKGLLPPY